MSNIISLFSNNTQITFQRQEDGYINATALCKAEGREFNTWNRSKTTIAFLKELSSATQICGTELVQIQQGGDAQLQGTWVHPQVAINLAQWLSPKFAVQVSKWVQDWITKKHTPARELSRLEILQIAIENERKVLELENTVKEKADTIARQQITIENAKDLFKQIADKTGCVKFQACARHLGITDTVLRTLLVKNGWRYKSKHFPTTDGVNRGYVKLLPEEFDVKFKDGNTQKKSRLVFYITEKGYNKVLEQITGILAN